MPLIDLHPTTRRFPRSRMEAYPHEYASGIEYYKRPRNNFFVVVILYVIGIICFSIIIGLI